MDSVTDTLGTTFPRFPLTRLRQTRLAYDARGKMLSATDAEGYRDTLTVSYSGIGNLTSSKLIQRGFVLAVPHRFVGTEAPLYDAMGNVRGGTSRDSTFFNGTLYSVKNVFRATTYASNGRMATDTITGSSSGTRTFAWDLAGNGAFQKLVGLTTGHAAEDRASFYAADGVLRAADRRQVSQGQQFSTGKYTFEEYRYDALGRRVWVRGQRSCEFVTDPPDNLVECQAGYVRRTVWDGSQELAEIQVPGAAAHSAWWERDTGYVELPQIDSRDPNPYYGRVVYTYGLVTDQPISTTRYAYADHPTSGSYTPWPSPFSIITFWNTRGTAVLGAFASGQAYLQYTAGGSACPNPNIGAQRCVLMKWPLSWSAYDQRKGFIPEAWFGTLLEDKQDRAGTAYRRNRVYDPQTGQFTQEDPIGLAGGLNLYGFANGDPVNFADPFGLCPEVITGRPCSNAVAIAIGLIPGIGDIVDVGSALAGRDLLTGENLTGVGVGVTLAGTIFGSGKVAREAARAVSGYTDITQRGARVWNRATDVAAGEFGENLAGAGFARVTRVDGIEVFTKGDRRYVVRGPQHSNSGWTADVYVGDELVGKIRLGR